MMCKIVLQAKFVKFKVKHFVEIPTIRHDKAVPPLLDCLKSSPPLNVSPPWLLKFSSCPPCLVDDTKIIPPPDPRGGGHYDGPVARRCCLLHPIKQNCLLKSFLTILILMIQVSLYLFSLLELI